MNQTDREAIGAGCALVLIILFVMFCALMSLATMR